MNETTAQPGPGAHAAPGATGPAPGAGPQRPPLTRSRSDRRVAGVCGGVAAYFGIDPLILRIVVVVLTLFGGSGLLLYAAGWLLIPDEGSAHSEIERVLGRDRTRGPSVGAVVVTVVAVIVLVTSIGVGAAVGRDWWFGGPDIWPLVVVGAVVALVWYSRRDRAADPAAPPVPPTSEATVPTPAQSTVPTGAAPQAYAGAVPADAPTLVDLPVGAGGPPGAGVGGQEHVSQPPPPPPPRPARRRSVLGPVTWWTGLVAAGVMILGDRAGWWHLRPVVFLAVLLAIVGLALVLGAFVGRSRGLVAAGVLLSLATALVGTVPTVGNGRTGTVEWKPTSIGAVPAAGYSLGAGKATLDLTATTLDSSTQVHVQVGAGQLLVVVPAGTRVVLDATVGVGTLRTPDGRKDDGVGPTSQAVFGPSSSTAPTVNLLLELGFGVLEVRYA